MFVKRHFYFSLEQLFIASVFCPSFLTISVSYFYLDMVMIQHTGIHASFNFHLKSVGEIKLVD